ncbi:MFS general substrate transporter [Aureobasidium subglaciale]|nr:MFS general substrate transporter [Aureobasidium subglaciale]KAI5224882.1 MFS general substrate transporter [Aureobasidium subglaciale]KAI5227899.1 MFS general substrate transporter [Aureobasidium subglaciale]KAI5255668.1 MFS general substrate transporter [Aureobasidium subglaciale]KAI5263552.1 MFS general substrate transporter [Aureobasidium subglaciale]
MTYPLGNSPPDGQRIGSNSSEKREYEPSALGSLTLSTSSTVDDTEKNWPTGWRPYAALFGGFLLMFCAWGTVNFYGTFASYYSESLFRGDDMLLSNLVGSTQCFVVLFFSFIVGRLLDANHSRQLLLAGSVIITIGMFMLSISNGNGGLNQGNYGLTWLTQGLVTGLVTATWFHKRKGFAIGIVASGASISGLVMPVMLRFLITSQGFNNAVRYVTIVISVASFAAVLLARPNPAHTFRKPEKWLSKRTWVDTSAFRDAAFCWFTASIAALFLGFYCVFFNLEEWAATNGIAYKGTAPSGGQTTLSTYWLLSIMNGCSTFGRLSSAWLCDRFGALNVHMTVTIVASILCLFLWTFANTLAPALAFAILFGAFSGSVIGLPPASMAAILGPEADRQAKLGQWTGMMYTAAAPFALVGPVIAGHLVTRYDTYLGVQIWSGVCLLLSAICMAMAVLVTRKKSMSSGRDEKV